jgi:enoyl-CoA hydratase/carnithine racemase
MGGTILRPPRGYIDAGHDSPHTGLASLRTQTSMWSDQVEFDDLSVSVDGAIGSIMLNRPERLNALTYQTLHELATAARWFDDQGDVKVVTVTGAGKAFSSGFDLNAFAAPDPNAPPRELADVGRIMADAVTDMRAITIVGMHERCVGGALILAAACDLRIASHGCLFSIPEADLGIPLGWGGIPRLVREIGPAATKELVLTCREFTAAEAAAMGFLNSVVPPDRLTTAVDELAAKVAGRSQLVIRATKSHVNAVSDEIASTADARRDADVIVSALTDEESRAVGAAYLQRFHTRGM